MITIKDVAARAGVSISTVSRTLSGKTFVEEATRQRVLEAVAALEYKPNLMARSLKSGASRTLALILPSILNPYYAKLASSFESVVRKKKYVMMLFISGSDKELEVRQFETLKGYNVDGVIFVPSSDDLEHLKRLKKIGLPTVIVNRSFDVDFPMVTNDNFDGAYQTLSYLIRNGHRKISCMMSDLRLQHYRQRYEGAIAAFRDHGVTGYEKYLVYDIESAHDAYENAIRLLKSEDPPTAFFSFRDIDTSGIYSGVRSCGLEIPDDISIVSYDNIADSEYMNPPLTTYDHPAQQIAEKAMDLLLEEMKPAGERKEKPAVRIRGSLVIRGSVKEASD